MGNYTCYADGYENVRQTHIFQVNGKTPGFTVTSFAKLMISQWTRQYLNFSKVQIFVFVLTVSIL